MKMAHIADLHLGKRVHGFSMAEDQRHILNEIAGIIRAEEPDALLIAGDVFDKAQPSEEAVTMFGDFLTEVSGLGCPVYAVAGNHDSGARLAYCGGLLEKSEVHIAGAFAGRAVRHDVEDAYGRLSIWLLPYFRTSEVRAASGEDIRSYAEAMSWILAESGVDPAERNVLVAHQFFTAGSPPKLSESEDQRPEVGGLSDIPASLLDPFDYVALGHLHIPQRVGRDSVRYSGSPLKYSASEAGTPKSVTVVEVRGKGDVSVSAVPLTPLRDMRVATGTVEQIVSAALMEGPEREDYMFVRLTEYPSSGVDEVYRAYPNTMGIEILGKDGAGHTSDVKIEAVENKSLGELFAGFYLKMTGDEMDAYQMGVLRGCLEANGGDAE